MFLIHGLDHIRRSAGLAKRPSFGFSRCSLLLRFLVALSAHTSRRELFEVLTGSVLGGRKPYFSATTIRSSKRFAHFFHTNLTGTW